MNVTKISVDTQGLTRTQLRDREWLLTNGLGGYASGTVGGDIARRYHGLFLPNLANPKGRHLMISRYSEEYSIGDSEIQIGDQDYSDNAPPPNYLRSFCVAGNSATWIYELPGANVERCIFMPHGQNTVCVRYRLLEGKTVAMRLRPYLAFRRQDAELNRPGYGPFTFSIQGDRCEATLLNSPLLLRMLVRPTPTRFMAQEISAEHQLLREKSRGSDFQEAVYSPGYFQTDLMANAPVAFIASTQNWERLDFDVSSTLDAEMRRTEKLISLAGTEKDEFAATLTSAADQFLVLPANRIEEAVLANSEGHELRTVIAGYHWFGDWGRDTMISLDGLMLCTGRVREARATLQTFASYLHEGLLPNLFPEGERLGLYNTVDATLWYFHAINRYVKVTGDRALLRELMPALRSIIEHHRRGTLFGIHMDSVDGLISASAEGYQLTWMDAKVGDWIVTPRRGKPVEIQALWYNALRLMADWNLEGITNEDVAKERSASNAALEDLAAKVKSSFNSRYWNEQRGCLLDVVDSPTGDDASVRPNQMFSISLAYPVLEESRWRSVIDTVQSELLTPFGLRTLSKDHPNYKATYTGDLRSRDAAYHQGTVWPWLMGHFIEAWLKVHRDKARARDMLQAFNEHFTAAGIGTISEIFDAEQPHTPHGCIAQAWSIGEVLRAWQMTAPS